MSQSNSDSSAFHIPKQGFWANLWKVSAVAGAVGIVVAAFGYTVDAERFAYSYLFAFWLALTVAFGSMFFVLIQHITAAGWSVTVRRTAEFLARGVITLPFLIVPVLLCVHTLYPWLELEQEHGVAHAQEHGHGEQAQAHGEQAQAHGHEAEEEHGPSAHGEAAHGAAHHGPEHVAHHKIMTKKAPYLNSTFFYVRMALYLLAWLWISRVLFSKSVRQDESGDPSLTVGLNRFAMYGMPLLVFTMTFAAFDWYMSLMPNWYSTMWGVHMFASSMVIVHSLIIVITLSLRNAGLLGNAVNVEHYHDLGKLQFGFLVFWGYITFSEFFLIWYAAIPEETAFYHLRWDDPTWRWVSISIVALHFIVPFFLILSRNVKRNLPVLGFACVWILVMHVIEGYYLVLPFYGGPELEFSMAWIDLACVFGVLGVYFAFVFRGMLRYPLVPLRDPRRSRAEQFVNA